MVVHNPQLSRRSFEVVGPADDLVERVTGLLMTCHYFYRRPGRGAASVSWREEIPELVAVAARPSVAAAIVQAVEGDADLDMLIDVLRSVFGPAAR